LLFALLASANPGARGPLALKIAARATAPGELVVVTIDAPANVAEVHVRAFNRDVPAYRDADQQWRALVGIDLDVKPATYPIVVHAAGAQATYDLVVAPKTFRTRRLTVDPDFVTPPPSAAERIANEAAFMRTVWQSSARERLWTAPFSSPVRETANSAFGTRSVFNGRLRSAHGGADFPSAAGTPVHAPNAGRILVARDLYFSGNTVVIDHGLDLFSMLAHLSAFDVREGDRVGAGDVVGRVGATGRVTGPHLHWAVRITGSRVDPISLLAVIGQP